MALSRDPTANTAGSQPRASAVAKTPTPAPAATRPAPIGPGDGAVPGTGRAGRDDLPGDERQRADHPERDAEVPLGRAGPGVARIEPDRRGHAHGGDHGTCGRRRSGLQPDRTRGEHERAADQDQHGDGEPLHGTEREPPGRVDRQERHRSDRSDHHRPRPSGHRGGERTESPWARGTATARRHAPAPFDTSRRPSARTAKRSRSDRAGGGRRGAGLQCPIGRGQASGRRATSVPPSMVSRAPQK